MSLHEYSSLWVSLNGLQISAEVGVSVGVAIGKKHAIFIVFKGVSECHGVVESREGEVFPDLILIVGNIRASTMPPYLLVGCLFLGVD